MRARTTHCQQRTKLASAQGSTVVQTHPTRHTGHHHIQPPTHIKPQRTKCKTTTPDHKADTAGKSSNPRQHVAVIKPADKKANNITIIQKKFRKSEHLPLQSPYTRVYGKREVYDESRIPQTKQNHIKIGYTYEPNTKLPPISYNKLVTPNLDVNCRLKMTGRGAARDLTTDPDFLMREANSPPQGTKRSGGNRSTSAEKKNKPAPREKSAPKKQF